MKKTAIISLALLLLTTAAYGWSQDKDMLGTFYNTSYSEVNTQIIAEQAIGRQCQSNGFRVEYRDPDSQCFGHDDVTDRTISNALFISATGTNEHGHFVESGKDIHGVMAVAIAKTTKWNNRGVSAFGGVALQAGSGVATNEFWAGQPEWSTAPASQLVGVFAVVNPAYADCGDRDYTALQCVNASDKQAQNCISAHGDFNTGINLMGVDAAWAGIRMSRSIAGSIIEYQDGAHTSFVDEEFTFVKDSRTIATVTATPMKDTDVVTIGWLRAQGLLDPKEKPVYDSYWGYW